MPSDQRNKRDAGKARVELLPIRPLLKAAQVFGYGADKYTEGSWRLVNDWRGRYYASTLRHLFAWKRGKLVDKESGLSHLAHALTNLMIMVELEEADNGIKADADN